MKFKGDSVRRPVTAGIFMRLLFLPEASGLPVRPELSPLGMLPATSGALAKLPRQPAFLWDFLNASRARDGRNFAGAYFRYASRACACARTGLKTPNLPTISEQISAQ